MYDMCIYVPMFVDACVCKCALNVHFYLSMCILLYVCGCMYVIPCVFYTCACGLPDFQGFFASTLHNVGSNYEPSRAINHSSGLWTTMLQHPMTRGIVSFINRCFWEGDYGIVDPHYLSLRVIPCPSVATIWGLPSYNLYCKPIKS